LNVAGIIPARYASTRFPGKPLVEIAGKSMIMRVYEQVKKAKLIHEVIVATDDWRIFDHVQAAGGRVVMTADHHQSGTDRIAEVARKLKDIDLVLNIQGDEPFIHPDSIDSLIKVFAQQPTARIATLANPIHQQEDLRNPNIVKVVFSRSLRALYFSRLPIPYIRDAQPTSPPQYYRHLGIYAFRLNTLLQLSELPPSTLEKAESLEQLRWMEHDFPINIALTPHVPIAVDTEEDLEKLNKWLKLNPQLPEE